MDELHNIAMTNLKKQTPKFNSIREMLLEMGYPAFMLPSQDDPSMYVLTNENKVYGAAMILNNELLSNIRDVLNRDFIIIPSSIHEVIIVPISDDIMDINEYSKMIQEVNTSEVDSKEVLSDHPYLYTKNNGFKSIM